LSSSSFLAFSGQNYPIDFCSVTTRPTAFPGKVIFSVYYAFRICSFARQLDCINKFEIWSGAAINGGSGSPKASRIAVIS
jgi:hypothetical protein